MKKDEADEFERELMQPLAQVLLVVPPAVAPATWLTSRSRRLGRLT